MRKNTGRQPAGELAPRNMPEPQQPQHDSPQHASQGAPAEEEDHDFNNEDKDDDEYSPLSDTEGEKLYRDAEELKSFGAEALILTGRLHALLGHLGITSAQRYRIKGVPRPGGWNSRPSQRSSLGPGFPVGTSGQPLEHLSVMLWLMPPGRPSLLGAISTRASCRTPSTASCLSGRRTSSRPLG
jgi:hypothetical protein